jgi:hypothetical protein
MKKVPISIKTTQGPVIVQATFIGVDLKSTVRNKIVGKIMAHYYKSPIDIDPTSIIALNIGVNDTIKRNQARFDFKCVLYYEGRVGFKHQEFSDYATSHVDNLEYA